MKQIKNLTRTRDALAAFDAANAKWTADNVTNMNTGEAMRALERLETLDEAIGVAFGLDTSDRNNPHTCKMLIRNGDVRELVKDWEKRLTSDNLKV